MAATTEESLPEVPDVADTSGGLAARVERWRVPALVGLAVVVIGSLGLLAWGSVRREKLDGLRAEMDAIVDALDGRPLYNYMGAEAMANTDVAGEQAKKLEELRPRTAGTEVEPLLLLHLAMRYQVMGDDDRALRAIDELRAGHAGAPILQVPSFDSDRASLVDRIAGASKRRKEFSSKHVYVEPKADPSRTAVVETDLGTMKVVFYRDLAPKHIEAFVKQAKSGGFNGTRLYYARRGEWIELGGGARTRNAEHRDDREDDPALALAPEDAARTGVKHRRRMLTSVPLLSGDQGDRFAVVLAEAKPEFNALRTPFGELLDDESASVADRLGSAMTYGEDAAYIDRKEKSDYPFTPSRPVVVRRVSVWREGTLEADHAWDTSRVNTDQPEPEPAPPKEPEKEGK